MTTVNVIIEEKKRDVVFQFATLGSYKLYSEGVSFHDKIFTAGLLRTWRSEALSSKSLNHTL